MGGYAGLADLHDFYQMQPTSAVQPTPKPCVRLADVEIITTPLEPAEKSKQG